MSFQPVIGLECHVQLQTRSKAFSAADASFGAPPNHHTDPYTLALPGTLPVLNRTAVEYALRMAIATGCQIRRISRFARKHYFYPDLPKGFQISQYDEPLAEGGAIRFILDGEARRVPLIRIHMEEDAGKNIYVAAAPFSLVDLNRAGVPLIEIVSASEIHSAKEAAEYLRAIRQLVRYLGICDGNLEEGSLRCDANVSIRPTGAQALGTRVELKNMNSFRHVQQAIEYEVARQASLVESGGRVVQETRLWDADRGTSHSMRSKEEANDYRYFPEPDLPPLVISDEWIERIRSSLPELPLRRRARLISIGLSDYDADLMTSEPDIADYFDSVVQSGAPAKQAANWIATKPEIRIPAADLADLIGLIEDRTISGKIAKEIFDEMAAGGGRPKEIVAKKGLSQITDESAIESICRKVIEANPKQAEKYRAGNDKLLGYFVGQVMKETGGKANPEATNRLLRKLLA